MTIWTILRPLVGFWWDALEGVAIFGLIFGSVFSGAGGMWWDAGETFGLIFG